MFTHVVVYSLKDPAAAPEVVERLRGMLALAPLVTALDAGVDVSRTDASYDVGLVTRHPDAASYEAYRTHPLHLELLEWLVPQLAARTVVDFESD